MTNLFMAAKEARDMMSAGSVTDETMGTLCDIYAAAMRAAAESQAKTFADVILKLDLATHEMRGFVDEAADLELSTLQLVQSIARDIAELVEPRFQLEIEVAALIGEASALVAAVDGVELFSRDSEPNERQFDGLHYLSHSLHDRTRRLSDVLFPAPKGQGGAWTAIPPTLAGHNAEGGE